MKTFVSCSIITVCSTWKPVYECVQTSELEYKDADPMILRYGTIIFEISPDASTIEGWFVGYAAEMKGLIHGEIKMRNGGRLQLSVR
jgi:hypothetical protein